MAYDIFELAKLGSMIAPCLNLLALGAPVVLRDMLPNREKMSDRVKLQKQVIIERSRERLASAFVEAFQSVGNLDPSAEGPVRQFVQQNLNGMESILELNRILDRVKRCYDVNTVLALSGVAAILVAITVEELKISILFICISLLALQIISLCVVRGCDRTLDTYERIL